MYSTYKYVSKQYGNYDWYVKIDDDSFLFMDNLRKFLKNKNSSVPVNYGRNWESLVKNGYESGGASFILSREALKRLSKALNKNYKFCPNTGVEYLDTYYCLKKLQIDTVANAVDSSNLELFFEKNYHDEHYRNVRNLNVLKFLLTID